MDWPCASRSTPLYGAGGEVEGESVGGCWLVGGLRVQGEGGSRLSCSAAPQTTTTRRSNYYRRCSQQTNNNDNNHNNSDNTTKDARVLEASRPSVGGHLTASCDVLHVPALDARAGCAATIPRGTHLRAGGKRSPSAATARRGALKGIGVVAPRRGPWRVFTCLPVAIAARNCWNRCTEGQPGSPATSATLGLVVNHHQRPPQTHGRNGVHSRGDHCVQTEINVMHVTETNITHVTETHVTEA
ncbi:hypothetical protein C0Q70_08693 [Pomacea canaliculata]|uniref:Uncharacterized protein n=1 Tax=Pomacea canaliculata TaxID=400727 RepID=A0A2T7P7P0_POMCA|nr:hypothetical protein C0Q70_08693 [Pomacea canaliculata]